MPAACDRFTGAGYAADSQKYKADAHDVSRGLLTGIDRAVESQKSAAVRLRGGADGDPTGRRGLAGRFGPRDRLRCRLTDVDRQLGQRGELDGGNRVRTLLEQ